MLYIIWLESLRLPHLCLYSNKENAGWRFETTIFSKESEMNCVRFNLSQPTRDVSSWALSLLLWWLSTALVLTRKIKHLKVNVVVLRMYIMNSFTQINLINTCIYCVVVVGGGGGGLLTAWLCAFCKRCCFVCLFDCYLGFFDSITIITNVVYFNNGMNQHGVDIAYKGILV